MTTVIEPETTCGNCGRLLAPHDAHHLDNGAGPFCAICAESAAGIPFDQWLDEQWQRQRPH